MSTPQFGTTTHFPVSPRRTANSAVLLLPAISTPARAYRRVLEALNTAGIHAAFMHYGTNHPVTATGHPDRPPNGFGYLADIAVPRAMHELTSASANNPVWILGHSLGAQVAVLAVKRGTTDPDGLYFVAAGTPYYRCFPGLSKMKVLAGTALPCAVSLVLGRWPGRALRIGIDESSGLVKDWATLAWTGSYDRLTKNGRTLTCMGPADIYDKPLIAGVFADDNLAPRGAVEALCQHLPSARWSILDLGNGGHMGWLKHPEAALKELTKRIGSS